METKMPVIGGPLHGTVLTVPASSWVINYPRIPAVRFREPPQIDRVLPYDTWPIRKFMCILPGRTDRQWFRVVDTSEQDSDMAFDAIVLAWASGWSPPDSQSEEWECGRL